MQRSAKVFVLGVVLACSRPTTPAGNDAAVPPAVPVSSVEPPPLLLSGVPTVHPPGVYMGRVMAEPMSYRGADWLDRPNRDATQKPEHVLDVLGVRGRVAKAIRSVADARRIIVSVELMMQVDWVCRDGPSCAGIQRPL